MRVGHDIMLEKGGRHGLTGEIGQSLDRKFDLADV